MRFRRSLHAVYNTEYNIVWTPRYRRKVLVKGIKEYLEKVLMKLEGLEDDIEVLRVNVQEDHVHLVIIIPPRFSVAKVVQYMKSLTGRLLNEKFEFMRKAMYGKGGVWSRGYCVSTIGLNEKEIMEYVKYQGDDDRGQLKIDFWNVFRSPQL